MRRRLLLLLASVLLACTACERYDNWAVYRNVSGVTNGGDPIKGRQVMRYYGCNTCHTIPGIRDANALVGPPLNHLANRNVIAGHLPNTPENLEHWIRHPHEIQPHTVMPEMNISEEDARDITAYLYTLK